jgi:hypothetical protein
MAKTSIPERRRMTAVLEAFRAELEAIPRERFVTINVLRDRVMELTETTLSSFQTYAPALEARLSPADATQRRAELDRLPLRAQAYYAADLLAEEAYADERGNQRRKLFERVAEHDRTLMKWARPLFGDDAELALLLDTIQRGTGHQDSADDVIRLVGVFRSHWSEAAGQTPITEGYLDEAEADATQMLEALSKGKPREARDLARRAYTAWHTDYQEIMLLGRYLARHETDTAARFPGVYPVRTSAGGNQADEQPDEQPDDQDTGGETTASTAIPASTGKGEPENKP